MAFGDNNNVVKATATPATAFGNDVELTAKSGNIIEVNSKDITIAFKGDLGSKLLAHRAGERITLTFVVASAEKQVRNYDEV